MSATRRSIHCQTWWNSENKLRKLGSKWRYALFHDRMKGLSTGCVLAVCRHISCIHISCMRTNCFQSAEAYPLCVPVCKKTRHSPKKRKTFLILCAPQNWYDVTTISDLFSRVTLKILIYFKIWHGFNHYYYYTLLSIHLLTCVSRLVFITKLYKLFSNYFLPSRSLWISMLLLSKHVLRVNKLHSVRYFMV